MLVVRADQEAALDGTAEPGLFEVGGAYHCVVETPELRWRFEGRVTLVNPGVRDEIRVESISVIELESLAPAA
jgi:hypothetical protein